MRACIEVFLGCLLGCLFITSCTISFQNISTHGTASDLVDEHQTATPDFEADLTVPVSAI